MSVSIDKIVITEPMIILFEGRVAGLPMGAHTTLQLFLWGKAIGKKGKKIFDALGAYKQGDTVNLKDTLKSQYSGSYAIVDIKLFNATVGYFFALDLRH